MTRLLQALTRLAVERHVGAPFRPAEAAGHKFRVYQHRDLASIPARAFIYPGHLARGFVSATVADGGVGKSALAIIETLAIATGFNLLGVTPTERVRVLYWNGEDPRDEFDRRLAAALKFYDIDADELKGWLSVGCGRENEMILARSGGDIALDEASIQNTIAYLVAHNIGLFVVDPLKSCHRVPENDNTAMDQLVKRVFGRIAEEANCAVELVHHTRKTMGRETTVDDSRGAGALKDAVRSMRALSQMSDEEAAAFGIEPEDRPSYVRVEVGKSNLSRTGRQFWFSLKAVPEPIRDDSDGVQVATAWDPPDPFSEISSAEIRTVQKRIAAGRPGSGDGWRANVQAGDAWAGHAVAAALSFDVQRPRELHRIKHLLKKMISADALVIIEKAKDEKGKRAPFIEVGRWEPDQPPTSNK